MEVLIFFDDLSAEKQKELLAAAGVDTPEEMNWDMFPVTVAWIDSLEEEEVG